MMVFVQRKPKRVFVLLNCFAVFCGAATISGKARNPTFFLLTKKEYIHSRNFTRFLSAVRPFLFTSIEYRRPTGGYFHRSIQIPGLLQLAGRCNCPPIFSP